jgi:uncharacterized OB-fold protein
MEEQQQSPSAEPAIYLTECASCGGQFPTFRAICAECEDDAGPDGFRDGKKIVSLDATPSTTHEAPRSQPQAA